MIDGEMFGPILKPGDVLVKQSELMDALHDHAITMDKMIRDVTLAEGEAEAYRDDNARMFMALSDILYALRTADLEQVGWRAGAVGRLGQLEDYAMSGLCEDCATGLELLPPKFVAHDIPGSGGAVRSCGAIDAMEEIKESDEYATQAWKK